MLTLAAVVLACCAPSPTTAHAFARSLAVAGPRPAAGVGERRAHARVAAAFRSAGAWTETWCRERLGWTRDAGQALAQAFAIAAGGWLLQGSGNMDQLERELGRAWRAFRESHLH